VGDAHRVAELVAPDAPGGGVHTPEAQVQQEVLATGQWPVDDGVLEDDAADGPRGRGVAGHVDSAERGAPGCRFHRGGQHADRRCLSGTIRPEQPERLAGGDSEADPRHRVHIARVDLDELVGLDRCGRASHVLSFTSE